MKPARTGIALLIVLMFCFACSSMNLKKTSSWMNSMYNAQYNEYLTWFEKDEEGNWKTRDTVTEKQKEILRIKKRIFVELHPLLDAYAIYASTSESPQGFDMRVIEARIIELINRLVQLTITEDEEVEENDRPDFSVNDPSRTSSGDSSSSTIIWSD